MSRRGETMSDEGTSADLHVAAPSEDAPSSVYEQLVALREAALNDVDIVRRDLDDAERVVANQKARLKRAVATAVDTGVEVGVVAGKVGVSEGTIRNWAKSLEGGA